MKCCEKGRSMIEMLGVLAIVGVLSVGGINGYARATAKMKRDKLIYQVSEMVMNIRSLFFQQRDFSGISSKILVNSGAIPHEMYNAADIDKETIELTHFMSGSVLIFPSHSDNTDQESAFEIYLLNIDTDACIALTTTDWGQDPSSGFRSLYVNPGDVSAPQMLEVYTAADDDPDNGIYTSGNHVPSIPLSIPQAMAACTCDDVHCSIGLKYF